MQAGNKEEIKKYVLTLAPELSEFINNFELVKNGKCTRKRTKTHLIKF